MIARPFLLLLGAIALGGMLAGTAAIMAQRATPWPTVRPGGSFSLTDTDGRRVTEADLHGKPTALYFGFTHCPDACPTALFSLTEAMRELGAGADRLNVVFVTVDPERDTAELMKLYLQSFDPRIRGLVGSKEEIADMAAKFHVVARRVERPDGDYAMDHSTSVFLFDATGRIVGGIDHDESHEQFLGKLKQLANPKACIPGAPASLWEASIVKMTGPRICS
ncbi:SCO family protein [Enterovirga rhinocerotis]|uniref:Protein SCO1/2 n=1 Tax=Enterovirga rhinocerotis TaxID=1339210 RepID=A0A4R7BTY5_9HYPH|nr:SCO family protein [Enterovirga rhinocerotis]TDR88025.1 protein SCO1/2 [Enterovirga rhinocerotis]